MPTLASASVDLVLCDLPYGTTSCRWDTIIPLEPLWAEYKRLCKGAIVLTAAQPFTSVLVMSNRKMFKYQWVYEKGIATGHLNSKKQPMRAHEDIVVFYASQPTYNPQMEPGKKVTVVTRRIPPTKHNDSCYGSQRSSTYCSDQRYPRSVIKFTSEKQTTKDHPTQKPVALMEYLIKTYTNPGDTVLDNCMGSGTTGVACVNTGRAFIGIERDPNYYAVAKTRVGVERSSGVEEQ